MDLRAKLPIHLAVPRLPTARPKPQEVAPAAALDCFQKDVRRLVADGRSGAGIAWDPLTSEQLAQIPEGGQKLQRSFEAHLESSLEGLRMDPGAIMVIMPARDEESGIAENLDRALAAVRGDRRLELAVVSNASKDGTLAKARAWGAAHASEVSFVDHTKGPPSTGPDNSDGRPTVHLLDEPTPGKSAALLTVKRLFQGRGRYPEWICQLDADTRIHEGQVRQLVDLATERGQVAATGGQRAFRQETPDKTFEWSHTTGTLFGSFVVARARPFFAGYEAIRDVFPQSATEDALLTAVLRVSGLKTGPWERSVPYESLFPATREQRFKQKVRFRTGYFQGLALYGNEVLRAHELTPAPAKAVLAALLVVRTPAMWGVRLADVREERSVLQEARGAVEAAERTGSYSWTPPR